MIGNNRQLQSGPQSTILKKCAKFLFIQNQENEIMFHANQ